MQFQYLPADERFYVRVTDAGVERFPSGAFSTVGAYPVYAVRLRGGPEDGATEFFIPAADGAFYWVDAAETRLARR